MGTFVVGLIVAALVALAVKDIVKRRKKGGCGCGCEGCDKAKGCDS